MRKLTKTAAAAGAAMLLASSAAWADLQAVSKAMGSPQSLQIWGSGLSYGIGQAYKAGMPWPRMNLVKYSRTDDYAGKALGYDTTVVRADQLGGTAVPHRGEFRRAGGVVGDQAWIINYPVPDTVVAPATPLQHDLWISPHGIVQAAIAAKAPMDGQGFWVDVPGKFKAKATVDRDNLVTRVESWMDNPVLGDMAVVTTYSDYREHGGVRFPARITQVAGGHPVLELTVSDVKVNVAGVSVEKPAQIAAVPSEVKIDKAAEGVWFVSGGSHNSVVVEMRDYAVLLESPLGDGRANPVLNAVKAALPNKPIRYVVPSHHHFDHSGGLRAAAAAGAVIVMPEASKGYFERAYAAPRTISPDTLAKSGQTARFETFAGNKHVISDGTRTIELHLIQNSVHADNYVMAYLPAEKIMVQADAFSPRAPITQTPAFINPNTKNLWDNTAMHNMQIETVLPLHGRMVKVDELKLEAGVR